MQKDTQIIISNIDIQENKLNSLDSNSINKQHTCTSHKTNLNTTNQVPQNTFWIGDVLIPMAIFFVGVMINWVSKKISKRNELILYKQLITTWIKLSKKGLDDYIDSLEKFAILVKENESLNNAHYTTNIIYEDRINKIPIEKITDTLIINLSSKNKSESMENMYKLLIDSEFIQKNYKLISTAYDTYCSECSNLMDEWNKSMPEVRRLIAEVLLEKNNNVLITEFHSKLDKILVSLFEKHKTANPTEEYAEISMKRWNSDFLKPAESLCNEKKYDSEERNRITIYQINNLRIVYTKFCVLRGYSSVFMDMKTQMENVRKELFNSIEYFERQKIKCVFSVV